MIGLADPTHPRRGVAPSASSRAEGIDSLRGLAATGIVLLHSTKILPLKTSYLPIVFDYLVLGVPLFFLISAFSMRLAYPQGVIGVAIWRYAIRRFFRIAPLYYVMLGAWTIGYLGIPDTQALWRNLTFTFGFFPDSQVGLVPAGWSIGVEAIFYLIFPFLVALRGLWACLILCALSLSASYFFNKTHIPQPSDYYFWTNFISNFCYFTIGFLVFEIFQATPRAYHKIIGNSCLIVGLMAGVSLVIWGPVVNSDLTRYQPLPPFLAVSWGSTFALIVLSQALAPNRLIVNSATLFLGAISYSLYLVHPLLIYATGIPTWASGLSSTPFLALFLVLSLTLICTIPFAWLLYLCIERPFILLGRHISQLSFPPHSSVGRSKP